MIMKNQQFIWITLLVVILVFLVSASGEPFKNYNIPVHPPGPPQPPPPTPPLVPSRLSPLHRGQFHGLHTPKEFEDREPPHMDKCIKKAYKNCMKKGCRGFPPPPGESCTQLCKGIAEAYCGKGSSEGISNGKCCCINCSSGSCNQMWESSTACRAFGGSCATNNEAHC